MSAVSGDADVRQIIAEALDETIVVEAAAGTGKTTELVRRILRVLATGRADVESLVAVTFTEKAAGELKLRLREELETARAQAPGGSPERARLERALANLEEAQIGTIHGFCADLLREHPVEAGVDPRFTVLTDAQARRCFDDAFDAWFQETLADPPEGIRRSLRRPVHDREGRGDQDNGPVERLRAAAWSLAEWRDFPGAWTRPVWPREHAIASLVAQVHAFARLSANPATPRNWFFADTAAARRASDELRLAAEAGDDDSAEAILVGLARDRRFKKARLKSGGVYGTGVSCADVQAAHQALVLALEAFRADADADLAALLREELRGCLARYGEAKARLGALDFLDLLLGARDLVRDCDDVRRAFQRRFTRLFVDEFQDTDPLQAEILLLLAADDPAERDWTRVRPVPGKLFIVGDPKQSIYRFRRADVRIYRDVCEQLVRHGARRVQLRTSFRAGPHLQNAVNAAFAPLMTGDRDTLQAEYVALAPHRTGIPGQPSVVALPVPRPYGKQRISDARIEASLPDAVGAFIHWLVTRSGWKVTERRGEAPVAIEPRHVCVLFRRFMSFGDDVTRAYVDALEARGIRHLLVGGRAFHGREEIEALRAALAAIEWPDDELSVFAALRGSFFAIGDEELLEYRHRHAKVFHPFRVPDTLPEHLAPVGSALRFLGELHLRRNHRPIADTIARLFEETRAHVGLALRRAGEQVLANALHVAELARDYERSGGISFRGFVESLRDAARAGQAPEAPIVEEGSDGVRLMTVHKAKGLEFPVVVLADLTAKLAPAEASRSIDAETATCALKIAGCAPLELLRHQPLEQARDRQEGVRLAYVAATRARDVLVIPVVGDQPYEVGWVAPINAAVYPPVERRRSPEPAPLCPPFGGDSVLERPDEASTSTTVRPGLYRLGRSIDEQYDVVWWDPAALDLDVDPPFGLRRQELISRDVAPDAIAVRQRDYSEWRDGRQAAVDAARRPSVHVVTATKWAGERRASEDVPLDIITLDADGTRPSGPRYGSLVHGVLATAPLDADPHLVAAVAATQGRILGASAAEIGSAADVVSRVLAHPVMEAARAAARNGRLFREVPVTARRDGVLVEGVADLVFDDGAGLVVVDFKTDRAQGEQLERYRRQVALYAEAAAAAAGRRARAILFSI